MSIITNIQQLNPTNFTLQDYSLEDETLIPNFIKDFSFNSEEDYLEYFIYDLNNQLLYNNLNHVNYNIIDNKLVINPENDLKIQGYDINSYNTLYNYLKRKINSSNVNTFYIEEISSDRTEIRLNTTKINNEDVILLTTELQNEIANSKGIYQDFYLNFGNNQLLIAVNILLDNKDLNNPSILIKLYEPLPNNFTLKNECWIVEKISEPNAYLIEFNETFNFINNENFLKNANFNLDIFDKTNNNSNYESYNSLFNTNSIQGSGSIKNRLNSILEEKNIKINIDYTDYSNFIHFSSALTRLENFYYKLSLLEEYTYSSSFSSGTTTNYYVSSSNVLYQNKINEIITNFDGYEYFLYYESGSKSWPKSNSNPPYTNYLSTSTSGSNWLITQSISASNYDLDNINSLTNTIPSYLKDDSNNDNYSLFVEMIGQHFDNIWVYIKDIPNKYNADNRVDYGISKDLITQTLRDFGVKIYQNNFSTNNLYSSLLGITPSGSLFNLPFTTGSLPTPEGYEYINNYVTSSYSTSSLNSGEDINNEIYKRIYHNLPYLLKKKGTTAGLKSIITLYGIPDTILDINEFGGQNINITSSYDYFYNKYNYYFNTPGTGYVNIPWNVLSSSLQYPKSIEFRFKTPGLPTSSIPYSQSLINFNNNELNLILEYTGSGNTSGSYSGSIIDNYSEYATLKLYQPSSNISCSVYMPFYDGMWWSVLINADSGSSNVSYNLFTKNKIYKGDDGYSLGFQSSSSFTSSNFWNQGGSGSLYLGSSGSVIINAKTYTPFSGSFQEFRYYNNPLSESKFNDFVMNPYSIEGNENLGSQSSYNMLSFRAPLGTDLNLTRTSSIHPSITGSNITQSFGTNNSLYSYSGSYSFISNQEIIFENTLPTGIKNKITKKIKNKNITLPYSSSDNNIPNSLVLSPFNSIQQSIEISSSITNPINYIEVTFSPQNEINNDIVETLGHINIGEYIGDPRQISSSLKNYSDLNQLRDSYFQKYSKNYNIWDYLRLIKYFDNSLFKMIKDWIPARTNSSTGITIKQHLLERNKYPTPQLNITSSIATIGNSSSLVYNSYWGNKDLTITSSFNQTQSLTGSSGNDFSQLYITQSWNGINKTPFGTQSFTQNTQQEFYNGELSGSIITVTTQSLSISGTYDSYFNALENNVSESTSQSLFMNVNYDSGQLIPTNYSSIINKTATKANIQSSNYTSLRVKNPRYVGSKNQSINYNAYTSSSIFSQISQSILGFNDTWGGDKSWGKTSAIDVYKSYGLYFNQGVNVSPELDGYVSFEILYMFDEDGNIYQPSTEGIYWDVLKNNFEKDSKVRIQLNSSSSISPSLLASLSDVKTVYSSGYNLVSPLTTQQGYTFINTNINYVDILADALTSTPIAPNYFATSSVSQSVLIASPTLAPLIISNSLPYQTSNNYCQTVGPNRENFTTYPDTTTLIGVNNNDIIRFNSGYVDHSQDYYVISSSLNPITPTVLIFLDRSISTSIII